MVEYLKRRSLTLKRRKKKCESFRIKWIHQKGSILKEKGRGDHQCSIFKLCRCNLRNLGKPWLGLPSPLDVLPFVKLCHWVDLVIEGATLKFDELSLVGRFQLEHRQTSTQISKLPWLIVEFGDPIFKLASWNSH